MTQLGACPTHRSCLSGRTERSTTPAHVPRDSDDGCKTDLLQGEYSRCGCDGTLAFHPQ